MLIIQDIVLSALRNVLSGIIFELLASKVQRVPSVFWGAMLHAWERM